MKVKKVNIQVNTDDDSKGNDFTTQSYPSGLDVLEAIYLTHRAEVLVGNTPTSSTVTIVWEQENEKKVVEGEKKTSDLLETAFYPPRGSE